MRKSLAALTAAVLVSTPAGLAAAGSATAQASPGSGPAPSAAAPVVHTRDGALRGVRTPRAEEFLGVPYAQPPLKQLRFAPPVRPRPWSGVRSATRQSPACLQFQPSGIREGQAVSEDCLYLDVYRPDDTAPGARLPVMVWFHGGGNTQGTGVIYGGRTMAEKTHTIIVTINYRLGALGFLANPALSAVTPGGSGNYGFMDQLQSLKWVKRNIASFGGDRRNVTIYGQSAGAGGVCNMLMSPAATGLFDKAIVESSSCLSTRPTLAAGEQSGVGYANAVGCTDPAVVVACLRAAWPGTLIAHQADYLGGPKVGGSVLPRQFSDALATGAWNKVPVLTGTTYSENRLLSTALAGITAQGYENLVRATYGAKADQVLQLYPLASFKSPYDAITQVQTDAGNACQVQRTARALAPLTPTYRYEFDDPTSPTLYGFQIPGEDMSNGHSAELAYLFDFTLKQRPLTQPEEKLSDQMMRYWGAFATKGRPHVAGEPRWPTLGAAERVMQLRSAAKSQVITDFDTEHNCAFWLS